MTTTDSGTETLFSDDSSCEHIYSPSRCSGDDTEVPLNDIQSVNRLAPPNIQPYSGVLEKGKVVIRPIAFKPSTMTPSARYGERYGSTAILTRPGSRLTLYGSSNDIHHQSININYSLDRKLRSSCPSESSSPSLAMNSLSSLPHSHKLINYDSLESVRKSPNVDCSLSIKPPYHMSPPGSLSDLTPSPSDSGVSELEAALRDRDSELAYLRQTMEHNEQVIFRVYQEKERVWERELRRLKAVEESRLRLGAQKILKLEQMLMMQTYQLQQEKKRLTGELQRSNMQNESFRQEVTHMRSRLEETEWSLCQKTGEISLLKNQIKECQNEQNQKCQELLQIRNEYREMREKLCRKDEEIEKLASIQMSKDEEISQLKEELRKITSSPQQYDSLDSMDKKYDETERLKAEIYELREELSEISLSDYSGLEPGRGQKTQIITHDPDLPIQENIYSSTEVEKLKRDIDHRTKQFENERITWAQEKEKVLRYQRQLQMNYVQMFRRTRALEGEIERLTVELELDKNGLKSKLGLSQTIEL